LVQRSNRALCEKVCEAIDDVQVDFGGSGVRE
jgi:hypothetical protein